MGLGFRGNYGFRACGVVLVMPPFFDAGGHTAAFFERGLRGHRSRGNMHMSSKQVFKRVFIPAEKSGMYVGLELPGISYKP